MSRYEKLHIKVQHETNDGRDGAKSHDELFDKSYVSRTIESVFHLNPNRHLNQHATCESKHEQNT